MSFERGPDGKVVWSNAKELDAHYRRTNAETVLDKLAQDARVNKEARMLPDGPLSDAQLQDARDAARLWIERTAKMTPAKVARGIGRPASSVTAWLEGEFAGDNEMVARQVTAFIEQHARGERAGMPKGFVSTQVAELAIAVMRDAREKRVLNLIYGPAGVGKSYCCKAALGLFPGSVHIECIEGAITANQFAKHWARLLDLRPSHTLGETESRIIKFLRESEGRLQLIDEAQRLSKGAMSVIRDVHKQAEVGVVLLGTIDLNNHIDDESEWYGQFSSLVNHHYHITEEQASGGRPLYSPDEIAKFVRSMGLRLTPGAVEHATKLACVPGLGGLRFLARLLLKARLIAGEASITPDHLRAAVVESYGRKQADRLRTRVEQFTQKVKVA